MPKTIKTKQDLCTGCNRCVRECPMETANITYQDEDGNIKVKNDAAKCIACGRCVSACKHDARYFEDATACFFGDLAKGIPISLIAAPSIRTNIPEYKRLFTYLKSLGVKKIYDVSLGADICIWAYVRYIEKSGSKPLITQPCPAIVAYCEMYRHDLLKYLSPVQSPMACVSIYMNEYEGINDRIAALSPCIAKGHEFSGTGLAQYNVTFKKLLEYLKENDIELPEEETGFDNYESGLGSIFPMPGGLKENLEFFMGKSLRIDRFEGKKVFQMLDSFGETEKSFLPQVFDVLSCDGGCNEGSACTVENDFFKTGAIMDSQKKAAVFERKRKYYDELYKKYDKTFDLSLFLRKYEPTDISLPQITDDDIQNAFKLLDKLADTKQNVDCNACGSDTCHEMARKIALGVNIPVNCIVKSRDDAREEHEKNLAAYRENLKQAEILRDMLKQFETVWNSVESGIAIIDAKTREILDINPAAVRMFGGSRETMVGNQCKKVFCPSDTCQILELNQGIDRSERQFRKSDGTIIPVIKSVARIHYNGRPALLENFTDMSYIKEAEEQRRLLETTEQANRAKSAFLATMSHEMRTPMNAIIGMTSIGLAATDTERKNECFNKIGGASKHLLSVINDILDMSKIEAGKFELSPIEFEFEKMLQQVVNVMGFSIDEKKQRFKIYVDRTIPQYLIGDDQRIAQVIINLLSNAVKFTPENGLINLNTYLLEEENGVCTIKISVKDTGIGISPEQQATLFQSFQQAESGTSRKFGGTGLGLSISKSIVEMMGGKIWVESEKGKGSRFTFTIKTKRGETKPYRPSMKETNWKNLRILAVDDDPLILSDLKEIIEKFGAACDVAASGEEALRLVEKNGAYDFYFVDWKMPGMDGIELTKKLKQKTLAPDDSIVIMISSVEYSTIAKEAKEAGVDKFLRKPLFPSGIMDIINEFIGVGWHITEEVRNSVDGIFKGRYILLAEDVEINREIVMTLLEPTLIEIDCASNGKEAVDMFIADTAKYDMIFMDIQMPEMDGYSATKSIRASGVDRAKEIPIVAMTANVFREDIERCLDAGMNDHIGKPLDFNEVIAILSKYLPKS